MRNEKLTEIINQINTEEYKEIERQRIQKHKDSLTPSQQLGYYVGEDIIVENLPTLSTDMLQSRVVIKVSEEDTEYSEKLRDEWRKAYQEAEKDPSLKDLSVEKWQLYRDNQRYLDKKYLPETLRCVKNNLNLNNINIDEFKKGLIDSLWNSDLCSYSLKPENITTEDERYFTIITLIRAEK